MSSARAAVGGLLLALVGACDGAPAWKGWTYPNGRGSEPELVVGTFETLEDCRGMAQGLLSGRGASQGRSATRPAYQCGYKCRVDERMGGLDVCEKLAE